VERRHSRCESNFTQTIADADLVSGSALKTRLTSTIIVGTPLYGGATLPAPQAQVITDCIAGTKSTYEAYPGTLPTTTGASFPASTGGVPDNYLEWHPSDTDLEAILAEGNAWDGYMVVERVGEFMASSLWGTSP